jgi:large conductance mechanosensitive channel
MNKLTFKQVMPPKVKLIDDFKAFALKGNVVDMAVGIIIGAAFGKIVTSLVNDIIMPPIGLLIGGVKFTDLALIMKPATELAPAVTWNYGNFIQVVFDFLIVAWAVFLAIKGIATLRRKEEAPPTEVAPPAPSKEEQLLTEIRDLLKNQQR